MLSFRTSLGRLALVHAGTPPRTTTRVLAIGATLLAAAALTDARVASAAEPASCLSSDPAQWPAASKPYFMLVVDTSGSMDTAVTNTNSCGYPDNRIGHARCAVKNTVAAFSGQVNFGLASFAWRNACSQNPDAACATVPNCTVQYASGNNNNCGPWISEPTIAGGTNVHSGGHVIIPMLQDHYWQLPPDASNVPNLLAMVDNTCGTSNGVDNDTTPGGAHNSELGASSNTPLGGVLFDMNRYFSGTYVDKWSGTTLPSPIGTLAQGERPCRSINIILVSDGDETCDSGVSPTPIAGGCRAGFTSYQNNSGERLASYEADKLYIQGVNVGGQNFKIRTHVIAFTGADLIASNRIATCGGTGAAYSTADEAQLSQALANIVSTAIKPEVCDNTDNNCNGCTDEGFTHYCNVAQTCCAWTTAAQRTTCLTNYKASIGPGNPQGNLALLPCTTAQQQSDPASWLCYNPGDVCDNADNNCNGAVDENQLKCGTPLACPTAEVCDGKDNDCDGVVDEGCPQVCNSSPEVCDGCDNDCDGQTDDGVAPIPCGNGLGTPAWCQGFITCKPSQAVTPGGCVAGGGWNACNNTPQQEACNGIDDDCNGIVDDNVPSTPCVPAGTPGSLVYGGTSQCKMGTTACVGGGIVCQGFVGPTAEVCDGIDNDCDGQVDEGVPGVGLSCGINQAPCTPGTTACVGGALVCQGGVQPQPEVCDGVDNNCDGAVDNAPFADAPAQNGCWTLPGNCCAHGSTTWCPPPGATCDGNGTLTAPCNHGTLACQGGAWTCSNAKAPSAEVCDGIDNNCNGAVDDGLAQVGQPCGSNVGECKAGVYQCNGGALTCVGSVGPTAEVCDGKDNDCNGVIDDGVPGAGVPCGNATLPCVQGLTACVGGAMICQGGVLPQPEVCDGVDNNCDGQIDNGQLADAPAQTGCWTLPGNCCTQGSLSWCPPAGATCSGNGTLSAPCSHGTLVCQAGAWSCNGAKGPSAEVCDGVDNNCNGAVDDGIAQVGQPCGSNVGECKAGVYQCTGGAVTCVGSVGPTAEVCDGKDNDCDGTVDNNVPGAGVPCGNATPPCSQGVTACAGGAMICQGGVGPQAEVCDGVDNDCDGQVDEAPLADAPPAGQNGCWNVAGNCCSFGGFTWCPPQGATCNGTGSLTTPCATGALTCAGTAGWTCQGGTVPATEVCDGIDNNCDGAADNVPPTACEPAGTPPGLVYGAPSKCVKGTRTCGACVGFVGPSTEICDGLDNDCDGQVDEGVPGVGAPCGINQPPCAAGTTACVGGAIVCQGGIGPQPEVCNGIDDNCDGQVDNAPLADAPQPGQNGCWSDPGTCCAFANVSWCPPAGATCNGTGSLTAPCKQGSLACAGASGWICQGPKGPAPEACDGLDNDCNGAVDDGNLPQIGTPCGSNVGECKMGALACSSGVLVCAGGAGPVTELCDGLDNDCDGVVDNGVSTGGACWPAYDTAAYPGDRKAFPCKPGILQCNGLGGTECVGGVAPQPEVCDGIDNDCDGQVDEPGGAPDGIDGTANPLPPPAANIGGACGQDQGECKQGAYACVNGGFACLGGQPPVPEQCDCKDNDCDGVVDNQTGSTPICSAGKACVHSSTGCQCAAPCGSGEFPCPFGQKCETVTSSETGAALGSFCVTDFEALCGDCTTKTVKDASGKTLCAPAGTVLANCVTPPVCTCKGPNGCQEPCFGVACTGGLVCAGAGPKAGTCVADNCFNNPCQGCGRACNLGACVDNPCKADSCPPDQVCKPDSGFTTFKCVASCAGVTCQQGQKCVDGACVATCDPACGQGQVCDAAASPPACVADKCGASPCATGGCCDGVTGACGNCPCEGVVCPTGQACKDGQCGESGQGGAGGGGGSTGSTSATTTASQSTSSGGGHGNAGTGGGEQKGVWGLATGGGGCRCEVGSGSSARDSVQLALVALALGAAVGRRRRTADRRRAGDREEGAR